MDFLNLINAISAEINSDNVHYFADLVENLIGLAESIEHHQVNSSKVPANQPEQPSSNAS